MINLKKIKLCDAKDLFNVYNEKKVSYRVNSGWYLEEVNGGGGGGGGELGRMPQVCDG